ncbi:MAG: hypothetical protein AAGF59_05915 [Pseudomonadota bacterium]
MPSGYVLVSALTAACAMALVVDTQATAQTAPPDFQGRYIAAISDGDMRAYAYIDGLLGEDRGPDELAIVPLISGNATPTARIEVPNTVINPVYSIAATPNGNTIFVAETVEGRKPGDTRIGDLASGSMLRAVDVSDPSAPKVIGEIAVGARPLGVSVSPDGRTLVIATKNAGDPLAFVAWTGKGFGEVRRFAFDDLTEMPELPDRGMLPHHAEWHPSDNLVAVTFNLRNQVRFYRVERGEDGLPSTIAQWGNAVTTTKWPMSGKFSRDGRHFVTNDLKWGPDVEGFYVNAPGSSLTSIRLADPDQSDPRHIIVGGADLPRHAESIAFSNGGDLIATVNIGQTWFPPYAPGHSLSSLSLIGFDPNTGFLTPFGDWAMEGILPEGIAFDASDAWVVAGIFEYDGPEPRTSGLQFWQVHRVPGADPGLAPSGFRVETGPGAHSLIVVNQQNHGD